MVTGLIVKVAALALALVITSKAEAPVPAPSVVRRPCSVVVGSGTRWCWDLYCLENKLNDPFLYPAHTIGIGGLRHCLCSEKHIFFLDKSHPTTRGSFFGSLGLFAFARKQHTQERQLINAGGTNGENCTQLSHAPPFMWVGGGVNWTRNRHYALSPKAP